MTTTPATGRKYQKLWNDIKNYTIAKQGFTAPLLIQLDMPEKTLKKALSKEKLLDVAFQRAFPRASLEMVVVHQKNNKYLRVTLLLPQTLTLDMFNPKPNAFTIDESATTNEGKADDRQA